MSQITLNAAQAAKAKEKGNRLFKDGDLAEAAKAYREAGRLDPTSPVYSSNLSAALYELGDYSSSLTAILNSWSLRPEQTLKAKLAGRAAKALCQGVQDATISETVVSQNAGVIKEMQDVSQLEGDESENVQAWRIWQKIKPNLQYQAEMSLEAKIRLAKLPIYKESPDPRLTYFVFGTDPVTCLVNDWGQYHPDPIKLGALTNDELSNLSFLLAGSADVRHAVGTVIGVGNALKNLKKSQKNALKVHVTLLDLHFATVARQLVVLMLLDAMMAADEGGIERLELQATAVYLCIGTVIPRYCHERLVSMCKEIKMRLLEEEIRLPSWIYVGRSSIAPIVKALDFWINDETITSSQVLENITYKPGLETTKKLCDLDPALMQMHLAEAERNRHTAPEEILRIVGRVNDWPDIENLSSRDLKRMAEERKQDVVLFMVMMRFDRNIELGLSEEAEWYKLIPAFVPPTRLLDRHPGFEWFRRGRRDDTGKPMPSSTTKKINKDIRQAWMPNITVLDGTRPGCMIMPYDVFHSIQQVALFNGENGLRDLNNEEKAGFPAYAYCAVFFEAFIASLKKLEGHIQLEIVCGEITRELAKNRLGTDGRPQSFPKEYTRIWLSNIPDYSHGTLTTATCIIPFLQDNPIAKVSSNCMWNATLWKSDDEFCYNYTLLFPKQLEKCLGVRELNGNAVQDILTLSRLHVPRPLRDLASRDHLHNWLSRLLFSLIAPGINGVRPNAIKLPNNLVFFIRLLVELRGIGYPSHWLSDFMHAVLAGTLQVDHATYKNKLPRPVSEMREKVQAHHVRLDPWYAELEMILTLTKACLSFSIQIPPSAGFGASTPDDIGLYKASPAPNKFFDHPMFKFPEQDNVVALLFYKRGALEDTDRLIQKIGPLIDGTEKGPERGTFHIFTTTERVDLTKPEVQWRMGKTLAAKMIRERWILVLWRMDFFVTITDPCAASCWKSD